MSFAIFMERPWKTELEEATGAAAAGTFRMQKLFEDNNACNYVFCKYGFFGLGVNPDILRTKLDAILHTNLKSSVEFRLNQRPQPKDEEAAALYCAKRLV